MMNKMKDVAKHLVSFSPYRVVHKNDVNRFSAFSETFINLRAFGYEPKTVIDCGANVGSFALETQRYFPAAKFNLVEPQAACHDRLRELEKQGPFRLFPFALGNSEDAAAGTISMTYTEEPSTGAHVCLPDLDVPKVDVPTRTLDELFSDITLLDRTLLKLDIQGYELHALSGGYNLLKSVEVVIIEVSFFIQSFEPMAADVVVFMRDHGLVLYDIVAMSGRGRDNRARQGDFLFVRADSQLCADSAWA